MCTENNNKVLVTRKQATNTERIGPAKEKSVK